MTTATMQTAYEIEAARWAAAGRPDHAAQLYAATLDQRPEDTRVRMMLADCLVRSHRPDAAAAEYLRVALCYAAQRRDAEAMALCYQVLHLDASQLVYVAVAEPLRRMGRAARPLCARAAEAHLEAGRLADGLHMLRLGAEIDERNPEVRRRLAQLYLGQHMITEGVANLAEAGRLYLAAGNNADYIEVAEQILRHAPRHLQTLRELPRVYLKLGEAQRAVVKLADLMRVSPGDTIGYEILAHAFATIGRVPTALSVLERLAGELADTGRRPQAEAILERALGWRRDDETFVRAVKALRQPKRPPVPAPKRPPVSRPTTAEGTVVLDIRDLMIAEAPVLDLSDEVLEEVSVVVRMPSPPAPRRTLPRPPGRVPAPRRAALPRPPALRRSSPPRAHEPTQLIDLTDVELDEITLVRPTGLGDVTSLVLDEDSGELETNPFLGRWQAAPQAAAV